MTLLEYILELFDYHFWGRGLILRTAEKLTKEEFNQETAHSHGSLQSTLIHTMLADRVWRERLMGTPSEMEVLKAVIADPELRELNNLFEVMFDEELATRNYLGSLKEEDLTSSFHYVNTRGEELEEYRYNALTQIITHGQAHRAEMAQMLTDFGHSPGGMDFTRYLRQT